MGKEPFMAGKKEVQANMLDNPTEGDDAPKASSDPKAAEAVKFCTDVEMDFAFGEGSIPLNPEEFAVKVLRYTPDGRIGTKPCTPYGLTWKFATIQLYHVSNRKTPIVGEACYMHWPVNENEIPKGQNIDLDFAETLSLQPRNGKMYLIIDGVDPAYGEDYSRNIEVKKFVRSKA
tara:strand:- start:341 stop:865 length:525 start_codon:yes stop_codon:yes gene_type:complete